MIRLYDLWSLSLGLSGLALAIMAGLIIVRLIHQRRERRSENQRRALIPILLGNATDEELAIAARNGPEVLGPLAIDLIQLVRGEERERFVATASRLGVPEKLRRRLARGPVRERIRAAEVIGEFPDDFSTAALEAAPHDRNSDVRLAAALALATSGRAPAAGRLVKMLGLGRGERSMLITALFQEIARQRPDELRELIEDRVSPPLVKAAAIEALTASGDYSLVRVVTELALNADPAGDELPRYLRALGAFQHPAALPAIEKWLDAPTEWVRSAAAEAAGRIHLEELVPALSRMLADPDWWVRFRAGEALVRMGDLGIAMLGAMARSSDPRASSAARLTLAEQAVRP